MSLPTHCVCVSAVCSCVVTFDLGCGSCIRVVICLQCTFVRRLCHRKYLPFTFKIEFGLWWLTNLHACTFYRQGLLVFRSKLPWIVEFPNLFIVAEFACEGLRTAQTGGGGEVIWGQTVGLTNTTTPQTQWQPPLGFNWDMMGSFLLITSCKLYLQKKSIQTNSLWDLESDSKSVFIWALQSWFCSSCILSWDTWTFVALIDSSFLT